MHNPMNFTPPVTIENLKQPDLAINYLRVALGVLLDHAEYRDPARIDEELLLGKLGSIADESSTVSTPPAT